jgi:very-short-patch-repair endonuclease
MRLNKFNRFKKLKNMTSKQAAALARENKKLKQQIEGFKKGATKINQITSANGFKKKLKKDATKAELHLIRLLSENQIPFEFQHIVYVNPTYIILDFYLKWTKTVIEIDGGQHFKDDKLAIDKNRDNYLKKQGIRVLRISNSKALSLNKDSLKHLLNDFEKSYLNKKLRIFNDFEILTFGKYSGMTISQIYIQDKSYLVWLYRSMIGKFTDSMMSKLKLI